MKLWVTQYLICTYFLKKNALNEIFYPSFLHEHFKEKDIYLDHHNYKTWVYLIRQKICYSHRKIIAYYNELSMMSSHRFKKKINVTSAIIFAKIIHCKNKYFLISLRWNVLFSQWFHLNCLLIWLKIHAKYF